MLRRREIVRRDGNTVGCAKNNFRFVKSLGAAGRTSVCWKKNMRLKTVGGGRENSMRREIRFTPGGGTTQGYVRKNSGLRKKNSGASEEGTDSRLQN